MNAAYRLHLAATPGERLIALHARSAARAVEHSRRANDYAIDGHPRLAKLCRRHARECAEAARHDLMRWRDLQENRR